VIGVSQEHNNEWGNLAKSAPRGDFDLGHHCENLPESLGKNIGRTFAPIRRMPRNTGQRSELSGR
jgi:hypothetical protein